MYQQLIRPLTIAILIVVFTAAPTASAVPLCGLDEVYDLSNFAILPFGGEILGATIAEGRIINTRVEITFTAAGAFNAADLRMTLVMPVAPEVGSGFITFSGADAGWSGQGTFSVDFNTDDCNGTMALDGNPWNTWFIAVDNLNPGNGPITGNFDAWRYTFTFEPCPAGDANCDTRVTPADIPAFIQALLDPAAYGDDHPDCDRLTADVNADGAMDGRDVSAFTRRLTGN